MKRIFSNKYIIYSLFVLGGIFLGWLFFHPSHDTADKHSQITQEGKATIWTCSMHPQIRKEEPGKCPICGMDLIPLNQSSVTVDENAIHLTKEAAELANVLTSVVAKQDPVKEIRLYGKVQADERLLQSQVAHIAGRIEKLMVNFTGEGIQKGQTLATIYSPEMVTAQQELLESAKTKQFQPEIYEAAKEKLRQWKFTESQIASIEHSGTVINDFEVVSNTTGIVTAKRVNNGDYVSQGTILFEIADLSKVWVMFDAYESDLPFLNIGDAVNFNVQAVPGKSFSGKIIFIDLVIDPTTRVSKVRVEIANQSGKLKPEMFVTGIVNANLSEYQGKMIIPSSAVLWTGKRSIVYVKQPDADEPIFKIREITLGPMLGNSYIVIDGLTEGEEIVTQGTFSVDAAAQLEGKPSMMNADGGKISTGHNHGDTKTSSTLEGSSSHSGHTTNQIAKHEMFGVSGNCEMCKDRIETAAKSVKGVLNAVWNDKTKQIHVEFNDMETNLDAIQKAIALAGHDTEKYKADNATYNALPECCRYRPLN
ncbi:MAG: efflux RND transporter periplasmic adaptor subunit [Bacteroidales bacterium]|nr:MAG: efflux RND transporter periplasmic adaptor subunit [Bacteroidales bacterium]